MENCDIPFFNIDKTGNTVEYKRPIRLDQAILERVYSQRQNNNCNGISFDTFFKNVIKDKNVASIMVKKYLGNGVAAIVFETANGDILKLTKGNHFPQGRPHENFDVPIFRQGNIGKIFYYLEEKLMQHDLNYGFVKQIKDMIRKCGYKPSDLGDFDIHQIGLSKDGKLYLIDPECAKYKTIFHALWAQIKRIGTKIR
ncbi:hypothetical protein IJ541_05800 [bacterium]|nr:hypothetical protein [bacterium]